MKKELSPATKKQQIEALKEVEALIINEMNSAIKRSKVSAEILATQGVSSITELQNLEKISTDMAVNIAAGTTAVSLNAARQMTGRLSKALDISVSFNPDFPAARQALSNRMQYLQQFFGENAGLKVYETLNRGLRLGLNPYKLTDSIAKTVGLNLKQVVSLTNLSNTLLSARGRRVSGLLNNKKVIIGLLKDPRVSRFYKKDGFLSPRIIKLVTAIYQDNLLMRRAKSIARTETLGATNEGSALAAEQTFGEFGVSSDKIKKIWLDAGDVLVRNSHRGVMLYNEPEGIPMGEDFLLPSGVRMPYPHALVALTGGLVPARERINCRCTFSYIIDV